VGKGRSLYAHLIQKIQYVHLTKNSITLHYITVLYKTSEPISQKSVEGDMWIMEDTSRVYLHWHFLQPRSDDRV